MDLPDPKNIPLGFGIYGGETSIKIVDRALLDRSIFFWEMSKNQSESTQATPNLVARAVIHRDYPLLKRRIWRAVTPAETREIDLKLLRHFVGKTDRPRLVMPVVPGRFERYTRSPVSDAFYVVHNLEWQKGPPCSGTPDVGWVAWQCLVCERWVEHSIVMPTRKCLWNSGDCVFKMTWSGNRPKNGF